MPRLKVVNSFPARVAGSSIQGLTNTAAGTVAHAEGDGNVASGNYTHVEGQSNTASGVCSHAEGANNSVTGGYSHVEGQHNVVGNYWCHAEGGNNTASRDYAHVEGYYCTASGYYSHAQGAYTEASGSYANAEGVSTVASGDSSHASGNTTSTAGYQSAFICGEYGDSPAAKSFALANGTWSNAKGLAFKVLTNGTVYADSSFYSTGADYAEYFEWLDGNPNNEDRVGYFVTLDGCKILKATSTSEYIQGIISSIPAIIGDGAEMRWNQRFLTDDWGRVKFHEVTVPATAHVPAFVELQPIQNPLWDPNEVYVPRSDRKEWSAVGITGKLYVRDDGTCLVNGYCRSNDHGIATRSDHGCRVLKRVSDSIIQVFI